MILLLGDSSSRGSGIGAPGATILWNILKAAQLSNAG